MRLLVVDDDQTVLEQLADNLTGGGHELSTAASAREALEVLATAEPLPQVLLTDIRMEKATSGLELVEQVHQHFPKLLILVMTGYGTIETAVEAMRRGAYDFLTKPFRLHELEAKLEQTAAELALRAELAVQATRQPKGEPAYDPLEWLAQKAGELPVLLVSPRGPEALEAFPGLERATPLWLTHQKVPQALPPGHLYSLTSQVEAFTTDHECGLIYLEGLGQLVALHGWEDIFSLLSKLHELALGRDFYYFLGAAPGELEGPQREALQRLLTDKLILAVGQSISHQVRLALLHSLRRSGPTTFNRLLRKQEGITSPVLNFHLKQLRASGLVDRSEEGIYSLSQPGQAAVELLKKLREAEVTSKPAGLLALPSRELLGQAGDAA